MRWGDTDPAATLNSLLAALGRLLQPALGDSAAIFVGPALLLLLLKMPSAVQPVIPQVCIFWLYKLTITANKTLKNPEIRN